MRFSTTFAALVAAVPALAAPVHYSGNHHEERDLEVRSSGHGVGAAKAFGHLAGAFASHHINNSKHSPSPDRGGHGGHRSGQQDVLERDIGEIEARGLKAAYHGAKAAHHAPKTAYHNNKAHKHRETAENYNKAHRYGSMINHNTKATHHVGKAAHHDSKATQHSIKAASYAIRSIDTRSPSPVRGGHGGHGGYHGGHHSGQQQDVSERGIEDIEARLLNDYHKYKADRHNAKADKHQAKSDAHAAAANNHHSAGDNAATALHSAKTNKHFIKSEKHRDTANYHILNIHRRSDELSERGIEDIEARFFKTDHAAKAAHHTTKAAEHRTKSSAHTGFANVAHMENNHKVAAHHEAKSRKHDAKAKKHSLKADYHNSRVRRRSDELSERGLGELAEEIDARSIDEPVDIDLMIRELGGSEEDALYF
jgi:hypothetical protein